MKRLFFPILFLVTLCCAGCASKYASPLPIGSTEEEVIKNHGEPTARYTDGDRTLLEYESGYWAQYAFFATLDANKRLIKWEQVLTDEKFASLEVGVATRNDLLKTVGHPAEITKIWKHNYIVWTYRYKKDDSWDYLMHFMFDENPNSTLKMKESGVDPMFDVVGE